MQALRIWWFNLKFRVLLPVYWRGGGRIVAAEPDGRFIRVKLPFGYLTRGFFGTHAGGAMYAAIDPIYVFMLARTLGPDYLVWDSEARIEYRKAGTEDLFADFRLSTTELATVRALCDEHKKCKREYLVELRSTAGEVYCRVSKLIYIRKQSPALRRRLAAA